MPEPPDNNQPPPISESATRRSPPSPPDSTVLGAPSGPSDNQPHIEGYQIIGKLGEGGMGTVWRALQLSTKRQVALKLINPAFLGSEKVRARFEREVELAASLQHPNVARVYDSGLRHGVYFYAMELIDGLPLDEYVRQKKLDQRQILELMRTVCEAVQHAHQRGVIHTDLKPSNILVTKDGQSHVLDFGLAKSLQGGSTEPKVSLTGAVAGTPAFMSPEQAAGRRDQLDTRTDVYSLGVILYRSLTGAFPHDQSGGWQEVVRRVAQEEPKRPSTVNRLVDKELEALLLKTLARDAKDRYSSAGELGEDIDNYLTGQPLSARPPTAGYFLRKWLHKHRLPVAVGTVVVVTGIIISVWWSLSIARTNAAILRANVALSLAKKEAELAVKHAELRLADSLVSQADALLGTGRGDEARKLYVEAIGLLNRLGHPTFQAVVDLSDSYRTSPIPLNSFFANQGILIRVAFSPDGKSVLSSGFDGTLKLWDVSSGREVRSLVGHQDQGRVLSVAFSPDGKFALSGGVDDTLKLWDISSGQKVRSLVGHQRGMLSVAFSPDGKFALSGGGDGTLKLWDISSGQEVWSLVGHQGEVFSVAFSPDGKFAVSGGFDGAVKLFDAYSGREVRNLVGPQLAEEQRGLVGPQMGQVSVAFSPNGMFVLSGGFDGALRLWDVSSGREAHNLVGHQGRVTSVAFSPDGKFVLSSGNDGTLKLWDISSGQEVQSLVGHQGEVFSVALSPDGKFAVSGGFDGTLKLWDVSNGCEVRSLVGHQKQVHPVAFSPDGKFALSGDFDGALNLWDVSSGHEVRSLVGRQRGAFSAAFSPDGKFVLSSGFDGALKVWDASSGQEVRSWVGHQIGAYGVAFSPDGKFALSGGGDGTLKLWDLSNGLEMRSWVGQGISVAFSPDGKFALSGGWDGTLKLWDLSNGRETRSLAGHKREVFSVAFSPDGKFALSGDVDGTLKLWDLSNGRETRNLAGHSVAVISVAFSPDGESALSGDVDGTLKLWDLSNGRETRNWIGLQRGMSSVAFSRDGKIALSCGRDGTLKLWDFSRSEQYQAFAARLPVAFKSLQQNPDATEALAEVGNWYAFRGVWGWAVDFLERGRQRGAAVSALTLARCYWELDRLDDALKEFQRAIEVHEAPEAYLRLCRDAVLAEIAGKIKKTPTASVKNVPAAKIEKSPNTTSGYRIENDEVVFEFDRWKYTVADGSLATKPCRMDELPIEEVLVAGEFNCWLDSEGGIVRRDFPEWRMQEIGDQGRFVLRKKLAELRDLGAGRFKFVINRSYWAVPTEKMASRIESPELPGVYDLHLELPGQ